MKTKQVKQQEAIARNAAWAKLSDAEKMAALQQRPGNCAKQKSKLIKIEGK